MPPLNGKCLCGQTTITVGSTHEDQILCHCTDCKRTSGSAFSTNILAPQNMVTITGPTKTFDMKAASGNTVTRIFCGNCGSAISHKSAVFGEAQAIQTGNFDAFAEIPISTECEFISPPYLFVKDRWSGLDPIRNAGQCQTMPPS